MAEQQQSTSSTAICNQLQEQKESQLQEDGSSEIMENNPSVVASHYNALPEIGIQKRNDSRILHLRNLNNWMKSMLISDFLDQLATDGCKSARVLDLCCGKGGDLRKWRIGGIREILMTDIAAISLQDCRDRYHNLRDRRTGQLPFRANFVVADLSEIVLRDHLPEKAPTEFDLASCQFALHYSFRSEKCARQFLQNATEMIRPGGYFIGTVPNACAIMQFLRQANGTYTNQVCSISTVPTNPTSNDGEPSNNLSTDTGETEQTTVLSNPPPLFGAQIQFNLEGVVNCPEYLCYFPLLKRMLEELDMELVYAYNFPEAIRHYLTERGREAMDLMQRMNALETVKAEQLEGRDAEEYGPAIAKLQEQRGSDEKNHIVGTLSRSEWEVVTMYKAFGFRKKAPNECSSQAKDES